jgi:hypothetical protein
MSNVVVQSAAEVWCYRNEGGDVVLARHPNKQEGTNTITILIPRANVPGLIAHLQTLMARGA